MEALVTPEQLTQWLDQVPGSREALCKVLRISRATLHRYQTGNRPMSADVQIAIFAVCQYSELLHHSRDLRTQAGKAYTFEDLIKEWTTLPRPRTPKPKGKSITPKSS
jgi:transcriptional regulator with XRE-family HTH domain